MRLNFLSVIMNGPQIFQGYWKRPEATADAFMTLDGKQFFRSGDLGRVDEEGYFFITDRLKRIINASGFKVWPAEVEALMLKHPAIQEACIISTRDVYRGESVKAVVVLRADAKGKTSEDDIIHWCKDNMAAYKSTRVWRNLWMRCPKAVRSKSCGGPCRKLKPVKPPKRLLKAI